MLVQVQLQAHCPEPAPMLWLFSVTLPDLSLVSPYLLPYPITSLTQLALGVTHNMNSRTFLYYVIMCGIAYPVFVVQFPFGVGVTHVLCKLFPYDVTPVSYPGSI